MKKQAAFVIAMLIGGVLVAGQASGASFPSPEAVRGTPLERIDQNTLEVITKETNEWKKLGEKEGKYRNPKTGEYTMVVPMTCTVCGEKIPAVVIPREYLFPVPLPEARRKAAAEIARLKAEYFCPKCGRAAYSDEGRFGVQPVQGDEKSMNEYRLWADKKRMNEYKSWLESGRRRHQNKLVRSLFNKRTFMVGIPALILIAAVIFAYVWTNKKRKAQTVATGRQDEQTG